MTNDRMVSADPPELAVVPSSAPAPAPWTLRYDALMVFLRANARPRGRGALGGFSAVMFVDYATSAVGPYRELLSLSPLVRWPDAIGPSVQSIWVTSPESAEWGNYNWGLTKSVARIDRDPADDRGEGWEAFDEAGHLAQVTHRPFGPALPVAKPAALGRLVQVRYGNAYRTPVSARALVRPTRIASLTLDPRVVDLDHHHVIGAASVARGAMGFGEARVTPLA